MLLFNLKKLSILALALNSFSILSVMAEDAKLDPCTVKIPDTNKVFDLRKLVLEKDVDYIIDVPANPALEEKEKQFRLNICHPLNFEKTGLKDPAEVAGFIKTDGDDKGYSIGKQSTKPYIIDNGLALKYEQGDQCPDRSLKRRSTIILFTCSSGTDKIAPKFVGHFDDCGYIFQVPTSLACSNTNQSPIGPSNDWGFFYILTILVSIYLVGGVLYNRFVNNAQGLSQLPNYNFWYNCYDFIKDMSVIILVKVMDTVRGWFGRSNSSNNYNTVPRAEAGGLFVDDDDEDGI